MDLKNKILKRQLTIGSWITVGDYAMTEIMAKSGFDWLAIDIEHSVIDFEKTQNLIRIINLCGITSFVRVGENNPLIIKRVMDAGAKGIIVPMINCKEDAVKAVNAMNYPPKGNRGVGLARAQEYGLKFNEYKNWAGKNSILVAQIEHLKAVENLEEILSVKGIDAIIVGPYDLSASMGIPGDFNALPMRSAMEKIKKTADKFKIAYGFHVIQPEAKELKNKISQGCTFLAFSLDALLLAAKCRDELKQIRKGK